ncbi:S-adenosyl-L-methionine-dependent tRNA 4-demethylwyosine synthase [Dictyocoela muelleri]|nr:S-adenosyl-L-methionine-dependent tRNA 4-demethylwyosine synthase [Dictyocoela muelleri]
MKTPKIIYGTETNKSLYYATKLSQSLSIPLISADEYDFSNINKDILIILISTYHDGQPPRNAINFCEKIFNYKKLIESNDCDKINNEKLINTDNIVNKDNDVNIDANKYNHNNFYDNEFKIDFNDNNKITYAIYGLGNKSYGSDFNKVAIMLHNSFKSIDAYSIVISMGDELVGFENSFFKFSEKVAEFLRKSGFLKNKAQVLSKLAKNIFGNEKYIENKLENDLEDACSEMITPLIRFNLVKQGYHLLGGHSAVKLCRWTKSMLKGRGGCYKHSFYGIDSHRCMEMTPNLACANKCVFCWRHHTNPVATEWQWSIDEPEDILNNAIKEHQSMIFQMKTAPDVKKERYEEAMNVRHCALSLVGEPIMYPKINEFIKLLHSRSISTFLVTNAQFPDQLANLVPVTQLYLSIDAPTKDELKKIGRPLYPDFWERYLKSISILKEKKQRTVFRLTLVKEYNMDPNEYKRLVEMGLPDFIEIKGATFCNGEISMNNIPYYKDVCNFAEKMVENLDQYEIACCHEHSCSVLIANKKFKIDDAWYTWIDFKGFFEGKAFYSLKTPEWALYESQEKGFDPKEKRYFRKKIKNLDNII